MNKPVLPMSSLSLKLPKADRSIETYRLAASRTFPAKLEGPLNRIAFSAVHTVVDPFAPPLEVHSLGGAVPQIHGQHLVALLSCSALKNWQSHTGFISSREFRVRFPRYFVPSLLCTAFGTCASA